MSTRVSAARPKRAGESFARTQHLQGDGPAAKRARFDVRNPSALAPEAPEEDAILELDEIGKSGAQIRRNAVNIDGYASDSSNEGFDARAEAKAQAAKKAARKTKTTEQEDENDMFADLEESFKDGDEDEELSREGKEKKKKNKEVRFLDEDDIEGQVEGSKGGGHVSADFSLNGSGSGKGKGKAHAYDDSSSSSSSESEAEAQAHDDDVDEEVGAGGKKAHAPKLSAFNMKEELEEGRFDAHGNFVRRAGDPDAVHDAWLDGVSKRDRKRAREAEEKRAEEQRQRTMANDQILNKDALSTLINHLERGETVLEALARLGRGMEKRKPKWLTKKKRPRRKDDDEPMDLDEDQSGPKEDAATISRRQELDTVTGAADLLLTRGEVNIYEESRESLTRFYRRETGDEWVDHVAPTVDDQQQPSYDDDHTSRLPPSTLEGSSLWEYRWTDGRDDDAIHGPYEHRNMVEWHKAGYFEAGIEIRRSGESRDDAWSLFADALH